MVTAPVLLIRQKYVIRKLKECGAVSPGTAVTFRQAGIFNPGGFPRVTRMLVKRGILVPVGDRFYLGGQGL